MIPLRDVIPTRTTPVVTTALIAVNVLVFFYELTLGPRGLQAFVLTYGFVPAVFAGPTILSSMFMHGGWMHLIGNMLPLWIFGDNIEDRLGHTRFLAFYVSCGVLAAAAHGLSNPASMVPTVGASGAIAGVMGAYFILYPHSRVLTLIFLFIFVELVEIPAVVFLGFWFLLQLVSGVGSTLATTSPAGGGIAFWAHVAGFAAGAGLVKLLARPQPPEWWDARTGR
jgi:rhomboid family protein